MSDSLRDQLLKAGFTAPAPKTKTKNNSRSRPANSAKNASSGQKNTQTDHSSQRAVSGAPVQSEPKAGYTHVLPASARKKKKSKKAPAVKPRAGSWSTRSHISANDTRPPSDPEAAAKRREMKAAIQALIDASAVKNYKGDEIYRFTLQNKIREILVSEPVRKQLAAGEIAITRLNGATRLIPALSATKIRTINPQWVIFLTTDADDSSDDDDEYPIPDDLIW